MGLVLLPVAAIGATLVRTSGSTTMVVPGEGRVEAASLVGMGLAPRTVIFTGEDGEAVLDLAPGITATMRPKTQVTIEAAKEDAATDSLGNPIPELHITLTVGTIVLNTTAEGLGISGEPDRAPDEYATGEHSLAGYSKDGGGKGSPRRGSGLVVNTPRGGISPILPGEAVITVTGLDPDMASVTVQAVAGSMMVTDNEGRQIPVGDGLVVILRPQFNYPLSPIPSVNQPTAVPPPQSAGGIPTPMPPPLSP